MMIDELLPVYGPVPSWRLGASLGIDLICSRPKRCSFNCIYCQLGSEARMGVERKVFTPTDEVMAAFHETMRSAEVRPDTITFSGTGEPTLASNISEVIGGIAEMEGINDVPLAILTNSSLLGRDDVSSDLMGLDIVVAKLDAPDADLFKKINRPVKGIGFDDVVEGMRDFRKRFDGKFSLQMMFVEQNKGSAGEMAEVARDLGADEVQINTPLRDSPVPPLSVEELDRVTTHFSDLEAISVYKSEKPGFEIHDREGLVGRGRPEDEGN